MVRLQQAVAHIQAGRLPLARPLLAEVLDEQPANFDALHLMGVVATQTGDAERGIDLLTEALRQRPDHPQALANLGSAYMYLQKPDEALKSYDRALALEPGFAGVLHNRGNVLQRLGRHAEAAETFDRLLALSPASDFALGNRFQSRRHVCDWRDFAGQTEELINGITAQRRVDRPFSLLSATASAAAQLRCARIYAASVCPAGLPSTSQARRYGHRQIRIAYVSGDFGDHVISHIMTSLYEQHDRDRFLITGVSLAPADGSAVVSRAKRVLDRFEDVSRLTDEEAARHIAALEIDIAVDLSGYTQGCRPGLLARRPAPIAINFIGLPGTLGAAWIDYLIADAFVVPPSHEGFYSEKIVRMPDSFQASDDRRSVASAPADGPRGTEGLPQSGPVLCCFNNSQKLNPAFFDIWMRLLRAVPAAHLWLLGGSRELEQNLRRESSARGVDPARILFAPRVSYGEHLARLGRADLFLDTLPFNGGATASDALWSGVPVLTCTGEAFASRMAGSLLRAIGVPELITESPTDYERRALELIREPSLLRALRGRIEANRRTHALFDTQRYCRHLESAYVEMWSRNERGESPASFDVGR